MNIAFYTNTSEQNAIEKNLTEVTSMVGMLREQTSILSPTITIEGDIEDVDLINYAYIPEFGRYYFVTNIESVRNGLWRISMRVDVLYTYAAQIKENYAIIERNEIEYDLKLNDGLFKTQQKPRIAQFPFPNGFDTWNYVLAIAGN